MNAAPLSPSHKALIRVLIYPIQFSKAPADEVERVVRVIVGNTAVKTPPHAYAAAIVSALSSREQLSKLIPQPHLEEAIREYLSKLEACLRDLG
jgi:hypothetical protein